MNKIKSPCNNCKSTNYRVSYIGIISINSLQLSPCGKSARNEIVECDLCRKEIFFPTKCDKCNSKIDLTDVIYIIDLDDNYHPTHTYNKIYKLCFSCYQKNNQKSKYNPFKCQCEFLNYTKAYVCMGHHYHDKYTMRVSCPGGMIVCCDACIINTKKSIC